jgi:hypothetical protein
MQRLGPNDRKTFFVTAPVVGRLSGPQVVAILKKEIIIGFTMSAEHSRTYSEDDDDCDDAQRMESELNSGAEDGASDGATMDSERSRHGKLSVNQDPATEDDSNDSSSHTPAQKSKRRRMLSMSPCRSPSPLPMEAELEPFGYDSLSDSTPRRRTGFTRPRINWTNVASWSLSANTEEDVLEEIARIMAASMADAKVEVTPKYNQKAISHFRLKTVSR